jgi:hypothetical protein
MSMIEGYELRTRLGNGPLGMRYQAIGRSGRRAGKPVTVTALAPGIAGDPARLERLRQRFDELQHLRHPGIPAYIEIVQTDRAAYSVTDFVDGETLADIVRQLGPERLDAADVARIVKRIGAVLAYAHDCHVSHGSLRLDSVIVTSNYEVMVEGFERIALAGAASFDPDADAAALTRVRNELNTAGTPEESFTSEPLNTGLLLRPMVDRSEHRSRPASRRRLAALLPFAAIVITGAVTLANYGPTLAPMLKSLAGPLPAVERNPPSQTSIADASAPEASPDTDGREANAESRSLLIADTAASATTGPRRHGPSPTAGADHATVSADPATVGTDLATADFAASHAAREPDRNSRGISLSATSLTVRESDVLARLSVTADPDLPETVVVWWTADGTALHAVDFAEFGRKTETIVRGTSLDIMIPITSDADAEPDEAFDIYVNSLVSGGRAGEPQRVTVTIRDDD